MRQMLWRVHAGFDLLGTDFQALAQGPAENIYAALGNAKECFAKNFPKMDTGSIYIDLVEAEAEADDPESGWTLMDIDEV